MIRKYARERREYLYRKSLEGKELADYKRKEIVKKALEDGKALPTNLRRTEEALKKSIDYEDDLTEQFRSTVDDEYAQAGIEDPKVFITTSRDPSSRLSQFAKEAKLLFPNAQKMNRGNHVMPEIIKACRSQGVTDLIILHEHRGEPDGLIISHLPFGPTAYFGLINCVLRHDIDDVVPMSLQYPHLVFENFSTTIGQRTTNILKHLFPVPKEDSKRVVTFANQDDWISFRHHVYEKSGKEIVIKEAGPRFELKLYQIKLGTVDQPEADSEWVFRPYMRSSKKRKIL